MKPQCRMTKSLWPLLTLTLALTALLAVLVAQPAQADTKQWVGTLFNNLWTNPNNWSPAGEPETGDDVYLTQNGFFPKTVIYNSSSNQALSSLTVNATGWGTITLKQSENALKVFEELVGDAGAGTCEQTGGTHTV